jgi:hypothetical protein
LERARPQIVNNFAERLAWLRIFVLFSLMNRTRLSNQASKLEQPRGILRCRRIGVFNYVFP